MAKTVDLQSRIPMSTLLGFNPGSAYGRVMFSLRERILLRLREQQLCKYAREIFPEEFEEGKE